MGNPMANLDSRRLRLLPRVGEEAERKEKEGKKEEKKEEEKDRDKEKDKKDKEDKEEKKAEKLIESSQIEPRFEGTNGQPVVSLAPYIQSAKGSSKRPVKKEKSGEGKPTNPGLKRRRSGKKGEEDMPPTPWGCEWLKTGDGWNLWRYWSEKDRTTGERIKKSRYAGYLSHDAWQVMKRYDYETFISIIGQRFRRYGQR
jgi:hypothetical protein